MIVLIVIPQTVKQESSLLPCLRILTCLPLSLGMCWGVCVGGGGGGVENLNLIWTATSDYCECDMMHHNSKHREKNKCKQPDYISSFKDLCLLLAQNKLFCASNKHKSFFVLFACTCRNVYAA